MNSENLTHAALGAGHGAANGHHGEILQGIFHCTFRNDRCPALVTLPVANAQARANFIADDGAGVRVCPQNKRKAKRAAELVLRWCADHGIPHPPGGLLMCSSNIPDGLGMGSSTADVVATIRAVTNSCGLTWGPAAICSIAVRAEQASDPLVFEHETVLFGHRHGHVLRRWPVPLPPLVMVGCRTNHTPVDTLAHTASCPVYSETAVIEYARLAELFSGAMEKGDAQLVGRVATRSALLNQARLPHTPLDSLLEICHATGGVGVQVAHSGCVASVLYDGRLPTAELRSRTADCRSALRSLGLKATLSTRVGKHLSSRSTKSRSGRGHRS